MFDPASDHMLLALVWVVLLIGHLFRADERAASRSARRRPRRMFGNTFQHDEHGLIPLVDPDGRTTFRRRIRR